MKDESLQAKYPSLLLRKMVQCSHQHCLLRKRQKWVSQQMVAHILNFWGSEIFFVWFSSKKSKEKFFIFLVTISHSLVYPQVIKHRKFKLDTNLLFIITILLCVYTAHSSLWSPRTSWSLPLKQMEKLRHTWPPTVTPGAKSRSHSSPAHNLLPGLSQDSSFITKQNKKKDRRWVSLYAGASVSAEHKGDPGTPHSTGGLKELANRPLNKTVDKSHTVRDAKAFWAFLKTSITQVWTVILNMSSPKLWFLLVLWRKIRF